MSCRKIARIINTVFLKKNIRNKGKQLKISFKTVSNYLSEIYGKLKNIRKFFFLSDEQKKKEKHFAKIFCKRVNILNQ